MSICNSGFALPAFLLWLSEIPHFSSDWHRGSYPHGHPWLFGYAGPELFTRLSVSQVKDLQLTGKGMFLSSNSTLMLNKKEVSGVILVDIFHSHTGQYKNRRDRCSKQNVRDRIALCYHHFRQQIALEKEKWKNRSGFGKGREFFNTLQIAKSTVLYVYPFLIQSNFFFSNDRES